LERTLRKVRALVVDDSRVMRSIVIRTLQQTNLAEWEFVEAENGADALARCDLAGIDIILADWNMPRMTGIEFVRKVRSDSRYNVIPIVMVTSEKTQAKKTQALDFSGVDAYLAKPFTVEQMRETLRKWIELSAWGRAFQSPATSRDAAPAGPMSGTRL
jgi:two-component system chemotaxis response regulator CheY